MSVLIGLSAFFLMYAILQPEWGSEQHWVLLIFAVTLTMGVGSWKNWMNGRK